jgi:hypothetical protein
MCSGSGTGMYRILVINVRASGDSMRRKIASADEGCW